jgi:AcrR family transcriptional regulator
VTKRPQAKKSRKAGTPSEIRDAVIDAAMACVARSGWRRLSLAEVAGEARVPLAQVLIPFPTKYAIINAFQDRIDARMLEAADDGAAGNESGDARDRLFDLIMERFDALAPYRAAMAEIAKDSLGDPGALCFLPRMARSMSRILEAAGLDASGPRGLIRAKGLGLIYADAFRVWLGDDSPDQGKTMATLDRDLRRAEKVMQMICRARPGGTGGETADAAA